MQELEAEMAEKDIVIAQQGEAITSLNEERKYFGEENKTKTQTVTEQGQATPYGMVCVRYETELKEQKILKDGDVLKEQ